MNFDFETFINDFDYVTLLNLEIDVDDDDEFDSLLDDLSSLKKLLHERENNQSNQKIDEITDEITVEIIDEITNEINDANKNEFDIDFDDELDLDLKRIDNFLDINEFKRIKFKERSKNVKQKNFVMTRKKKTTTKFIKRNFLDFEHIETTIASQQNDKNRNRERD